VKPPKKGRGRPLLPDTQLELFRMDLVVTLDPVCQAMRDSINAQIIAYKELLKRRDQLRVLSVAA
jgi:hypothetical protein